MPVVAVSSVGSDTVIFGSSTAWRGMSGKEFMIYFSCLRRSVMTAVTVVSLPVPAVVGMAMRAGTRRQTRKMPLRLSRLRRR